MDANSVKIDWFFEPPLGIEDMVRADIAANLGHLKIPESLGYHTVFLGDDIHEGPGVVVEPNDDGDGFICFYYPRIGDAFTTLQPNL